MNPFFSSAKRALDFLGSRQFLPWLGVVNMAVQCLVLAILAPFAIPHLGQLEPYQQFVVGLMYVVMPAGLVAFWTLARGQSKQHPVRTSVSWALFLIPMAFMLITIYQHEGHF